MEYTSSEMRELLRRIKEAAKSSSKITRSEEIPIKCALGIAGFVRFFEGYYMILITTRKRVAQIGPHYIYKVLESHLLYIPNDEVKPASHPDEQRLFQY